MIRVMVVGEIFFRTEKKDRILELGFELLVMWAGFYLFILKF